MNLNRIFVDVGYLGILHNIVVSEWPFCLLGLLICGCVQYDSLLLTLFQHIDLAYWLTLKTLNYELWYF